MTKEALKRLIGDNIRRERISRNMTVDELAELMELTPGFVGLIERGRRGATIHNLYKLSEIFGIEIDQFTTEYSKPALQLNEKNPSKTKRTKITSLIYQLDDSELDYVILMIKNLKIIKNAKISVGGSEECDEPEAVENQEPNDAGLGDKKTESAAAEKKTSNRGRKNKKTAE